MDASNPYQTPEGELNTEPTEFGKISIFSAKGRLGRLRYLGYSFGLLFVVQAISGGLMAVFGIDANNGENLSVIGMAMMALSMILMAVVTILIGVQRLHDLDKSGWLIILLFIPILNIFIGLYMLFGRGTPIANRFGAPPPPNTLGVKIVAGILPAIFIIGILAAVAIPAYQDYVERAKQAQMQP